MLSFVICWLELMTDEAYYSGSLELSTLPGLPG